MKKELDFGLDNFGKQKVLSEKDSVVQVIKNILFMVPGQMPSMPFIGIDINQYMYMSTEDTNLTELSSQLSAQCAAVMPHIDFMGVSSRFVTYKDKTILLIVIPLNISGTSETLLLGLNAVGNGRVIFNYEFEDSLI